METETPNPPGRGIAWESPLLPGSRMPLPQPAPGYGYGLDQGRVYLWGPRGMEAFLAFPKEAPPPQPALPPPPLPPRLASLGPSGAGGKAPLRLHLDYLAYEEAGPGVGVFVGPGCTYRCRVCSTGPFTFRGQGGVPAPPPREGGAWVARALRALLHLPPSPNGFWLHLLGGEPTLYLDYLLGLLGGVKEALEAAGGDVPYPYVSLVTNGHYSEDVAKRLVGVPDLYVFSLRAGPGCAPALGIPKDHLETVLRTLERTLSLDPGARVLVRVWVARGHHACCVEPALEALAPFREREGLYLYPVPVLPLNPFELNPPPVAHMPEGWEVSRAFERADALGLLPPTALPEG